MPRVILLLAIAIAIYILYRRAQAAPPEKRKAEFIKLGLAVMVVLVIVLTITGRMHWIGAAITGLLVGIRQFLPTLLRLFPMLASLRSNANSQKGTTPPSEGGTMTAEEALAVLGLDGEASEQDIINSHRKMMQKIHPDRGGSDYLAAKINQAKDTLT